MTESLAFNATGSAFYIGAVTGDLADPSTQTTWTEVPDVLSIKPPTKGRGKLDATHMKSEEPEYKNGRRTRGDCTVRLHLVPGDATHQALEAAAESGVLMEFCIEYSDEDQTCKKFKGTVESWDDDLQDNQLAEVTLVIKPTGPDYKNTGGHATLPS